MVAVVACEHSTTVMLAPNDSALFSRGRWRALGAAKHTQLTECSAVGEYNLAFACCWFLGGFGFLELNGKANLW